MLKYMFTIEIHKQYLNFGEQLKSSKEYYKPISRNYTTKPL